MKINFNFWFHFFFQYEAHPEEIKVVQVEPKVEPAKNIQTEPKQPQPVEKKEE